MSGYPCCCDSISCGDMPDTLPMEIGITGLSLSVNNTEFAVPCDGGICEALSRDYVVSGDGVVTTDALFGDKTAEWDLYIPEVQCDANRKIDYLKIILLCGSDVIGNRHLGYVLTMGRDDGLSVIRIVDSYLLPITTFPTTGVLLSGNQSDEPCIGEGTWAYL